MRDNLRRYRAIRDALTQCYPGQPSGTVARHLITLAALIIIPLAVLTGLFVWLKLTEEADEEILDLDTEGA